MNLVSKNFGFPLVREITIGAFQYMVFVDNLFQNIQRHFLLLYFHRLWCRIRFLGKGGELHGEMEHLQCAQSLAGFPPLLVMKNKKF